MPTTTNPGTDKPQRTADGNADVIDGRALAARYREHIAQRVDQLKRQRRRPRLDAVLVDSGDSAARQYADSQGKTCSKIGIEYHLHELPSAAGFDEIAGRVLLLNSREDVSAIMLHLPLPADVDPYAVQRLIAPEKDVEGVNPANIGNVVYGRSSLAPCTALAVTRMILDTFGLKTQEDQTIPAGSLKGKTAVIVGAGDVVGKPIAVLLMRQDATVISCNKHTTNIPELTTKADILIAAAGVPELITPDMVKPGAVVIDVGVNRVTGADGRVTTVGDVQFEGVSRVAAAVSPVPGGVGPVTVAMLLANVVQACRHATG